MTKEEWLAEQIAGFARERESAHPNPAHVWSADRELVGLIGEFEFGRAVGLMPDLTPRPEGDDGIDFTLRLTFTLDVKTANNAKYLIHAQGKKFADIFVLAQLNEPRAILLGWEWGGRLKAAPVRDFGFGVLSHYIAAGELRPMAELYARHSP